LKFHAGASAVPTSENRGFIVEFKRRLTFAVAVVALISGGFTSRASADEGHRTPVVTELATFAAAGCTGGCGSGSTVGPDGALYVTDGKAGNVYRIDPQTGAMSTFASGLPPSNPNPGIGGAMDVAFIGDTAYVLVTVVGPFFGQPDVVDGIYRIEADGTGTPIADIGQWSLDHPPDADIFVLTGVQYAMQPYGRGFLVTDGHHNRVLRVKLNGEISQVVAFGDNVPTGLALSEEKKVYMAQAGPIPHLPATGKILSFNVKRPHPKVVASGAPLLVDVEFRHDDLYALSQGLWTLDPTDPNNAGMPASANTGTLEKVNEDGGFTTVVGGLDRPTSLEFIGKTAYVVTLTGKVLKIDNISRHHDDGDDHEGDDHDGDDHGGGGDD
jgi:sugar lactone lactonase YvrE